MDPGLRRNDDDGGRRRNDAMRASPSAPTLRAPERINERGECVDGFGARGLRADVDFGGDGFVVESEFDAQNHELALAARQYRERVFPALEAIAADQLLDTCRGHRAFWQSRA